MVSLSQRNELKKHSICVQTSVILKIFKMCLFFEPLK